MRKLELYWMTNEDWFYLDEETLQYEIKDDAPEEAKKSFKEYIEQTNSGETE